MRFFKSFNILHRRTKSATFVPGPAPELSFVDAPYPRGCGPSQPLSASPSLFFELATTKEPAVPPNFTHLADRVSGLWRPKRSSRRSSTASTFSAMEKEHTRLRDIIESWISEHSKIQENLAQCRDDLLIEQRKVAALEQKVQSNSLTIEALTEKLSHYEGLFEHERAAHSDSPFIATISDKEQPQPPHLTSGMVWSSIHRDPKLPSGPSNNIRTADEYSSALRMTLTSRKQLREQKKITKFWKTEALAKAHEALITPSVSTISSIQEQPLSTGRQDALKTLIIRRGQTLSLLSNIVSPASLPSSCTVGTIKSTLPSSTSNASSIPSRLSPLASESMKAEINIMFGSRGSLDLLALTPPKKRIAGHLRSLSSNGNTTQMLTSTSTASSVPIRKSLNIESFSDLNGFFNRTFGSASGDGISADPDQPAAFSIPLVFEMTSPGPTLFESSEQLGNDVTQLDSPTKKVPRPGLRQASKDCTPRRSWQTYITRAASQQVRVSDGSLSRKKTKKNVPLAASTLNSKNKQSRLPVLISGRRAV